MLIFQNEGGSGGNNSPSQGSGGGDNTPPSLGTGTAGGGAQDPPPSGAENFYSQGVILFIAFGCVMIFIGLWKLIRSKTT